MRLRSTRQSPCAGSSLASPSVLEYAGGVNRQFGARAAIRADVVYRDYKDFYIQRIDTTTGKTTNSVGTVLDLVQNQRATRLEWYIIGLIVIEILLSLGDIMLRLRGAP